MTSTQEAKYAKDEKVLCKHGLCHYPAKILEVDQTTDLAEEGYRYFVHYQGWNPKWDEWVDDDRLDKFTDEKARAAADEHKKITEQYKKKKGSGGGSSKSSNKAHSESDRASIASSVADNATLKDVEVGSRGSSPSVDSTVSSSATISTSAGGGGTTTTTNTASASASRKSKTKSNKPTSTTSTSGTPNVQQPESKKRKFRPSDAVQSSASSQTQSGSSGTASSSLFVQSEQDYLTRPEVCVKLPEDLRPLLVDDWDLVVQQMKLVHLPAKVTVAQIFQDYVRDKQALKNISTVKLSQIVESAEGLCAYFDVMLPCQLLYKFEKPQYDEFYRKNSDFLPSECYGFIHLVRLFVRLGHMLACTALDDKNMSIVLTGVTEFLKYLKKIKPQNISSDYEIATPEYQRLAYS